MTALALPHRPFATEQGVSVLLILLGATVMGGWLLQVPAMVEFRAGTVPMVFNTALCFALVGTALLQAAGRPQRLLSTAVVALCTATLIEAILDKPLGVDNAFVHAWYDYGNTRPGRMAPNTSLGFMLVGCTLLAMQQVGHKARALVVVLLTFAVLAIGLTGLVGYLMAPELLFGWARSARMAIHTATGMTLCAVALWLSWMRSHWYRSGLLVREDEKIRLLGAAILVVVTVGLVGFVLVQRALEQSLKNGLSNVVGSRAPWFTATVAQTQRHAERGVRLSGLNQAALAVLREGAGAAEARQFAALAETVVAGGFRGLALRDADHQWRATVGSLTPVPQMAVVLDRQRKVELVWDRQLLLRMHVQVVGDGQVMGELVLDEAMPALDRATFNASSLGSTAEVAACARRGADILCFPSNRHDTPWVARRPGTGALALPVELAMNGDKGVTNALDYRGVSVIAAYAPLAEGLGFVVKQDTTEVYGVIREALTIGVPIIFLVAALGAVLLYSQLKPLATRLWASELGALEKAIELRSIMDAAGDGIITTDHRGRILSLNAAAAGLFGCSTEALVGRPVGALMPAPLRPAQRRCLSRHLRGADPADRQAIELMGRRADGSDFSLELIVTRVPLRRHSLFIGVLRDIGKRKDAERVLTVQAQFDALTGLPNRALFMDRLRTAALRAGRSGEAMALMFLDLDGFKAVNDSLGHAAGDTLLVEFARRLAGAVRKTDTVARLAGDEFTVVLERLVDPTADAIAVAEKIAAAARLPFDIAGHTVCVSASLGLVVHLPDARPLDIAELLERADAQMYAAKRGGKNAIRMG